MEIAKKSLIEVIAGIWILAGTVVLAGVFFVPNPLAYTLGEVAGSLVSTLMMIHLYYNLDVEMDLPEKKAVNHSRIMSALRSLIELGALAGSFYISHWVLPYTVLAGLFGRKFAAIAVPFYEEWKKNKEKGE